MKYYCKLYICDDEGEKIFGKGPMELLIRIDEYKSINKAASSMYLSYHKALDMIKKAERGLGFKLVIKKSGGINGGGSQLTDEALDIINKYSTFTEFVNRNAEFTFNNIFNNKEGEQNGNDTF